MSFARTETSILNLQLCHHQHHRNIALSPPAPTMSRRPTTFRVGNIPSSATLPELKDALVNAMAVEECDAITIEATIAPATTHADDDTNTALVTFSPQAPKFLGPLCKAEDVQIDTPLGDLSFDKTFYGLTQLYPTTPDKRIEAE